MLVGSCRVVGYGVLMFVYHFVSCHLSNSFVVVDVDVDDDDGTH